ncbi:MAG: hypothetical protein E7316_03035 [Clostridiales bacterium]|nr:hypothetical protein [Clostridiales bacterium]
MKKTVIILVAVLLVAAIAGVCIALTSRKTPPEPEQIIDDTAGVTDIFEMTGTVLEIGEGYYLIENTEGQQVQINLYEDTVFEGEAPGVGALIHVLYNGMMTRSLPPQINALRVGCYVRSGAVVELTQTGFTLDDGVEIIEVNAEAELLQGIETGDTVHVYFNGAMTMSLPAQIGAELIVPYTAE